MRKLGLPTRLDKGKIVLDGDFVVCKEGEVLGSGQASLLKLFGVAMAEFGVEIEVVWEKETGRVEVFGSGLNKDEDILLGVEDGMDVES